MGYSRYVGRIGALAVALGVGIAIGAPGAIASAAPDEPATTAGQAVDKDAENNPAGEPAPAGEPKTEAPDANGVEPSEPKEQATSGGKQTSPSSSTVEVTSGVTVSSSGGAHTSGEGAGKRTAKPKSATKTPDKKKTTTAAARVAAQTNASQATHAKVQPPDEPAEAVTVSAAAESTVPMTLSAPRPVSAKATASPVTAVLSRVVSPILSSILGALPRTPSESPLAWVFAAAARRQIGETQPETTRLATFATTTALVENQSPTVDVVFGTPVSTSGAISGQVVGTDPEGQPVTYALTTPPTAGTLVFDTATAKFTYTPTTSQRINAGATSATVTAPITVTVSDGTNSVPAVVNIPVTPLPIAKQAEVGGVNDANAVVATATRAYVTNRTAGTVTVIDTTKNTVIGTIAVGPTPDGLAIKPDGTKLYVSSLDNNTVTVVDTKTAAVVKTIAIAKPSAMAINSSGSVLYVTSRDAGTVTKITTATNAVSGTVTLPAGSLPTGITVSPDKTKLYVISNKATGGGTVAVFGYTSSTVTTIANLPSAPTGLAVSPDNKRLYVSSADGKVTVYDTATRAVVATRTVAGVPSSVSVSNDGTTLFVTDTVGRVVALDAATGAPLTTVATRTSTTAMSVVPRTAVSPDGTKLFVTDYDADKVYVVGMVTPNTAPTVGTPILNAPSATTGTLTGKVVVNDPDGDTLTYTVVTKPTKGTLTLKADGTFTYTPTATARHTAALDSPPPGALTDSFTVSVSDGRGGVVTPTTTVNILPANKVPTYTLTVGTPSAISGVVTGKVTASDGDFDVRTFSVSDPAKGTVVLKSTTSATTFTYTPTAEARHAAAKVGATAADKVDTFTVTINDGHGAVVPVSVTVTVSPTNYAPTGATVGGLFTDLNSGRVTGTVTAVDVNNDPLSFSSTTPAKGALVFGPNGAFTYTPTEAARQAASAPNATTATKTDVVTITVADGYGGTATVKVNLPVTPYGHVNSAPTNGRASVGDPNAAIGQVTGTLVADDEERDVLTYSLATGPSKGVVNIDPNGTFTYVPNVEARWGAKTTAEIDMDRFTVLASDGYGGTTTFDVSVTIAPPSTSASAIDQRGTTVGMNVQEMYGFTQSQTDRALDLLKADGVDTIRILIPWVGVEPSNDSWNWSAVDRMVNSAKARNMTVIGILNSPPDWAMVPGSPSLGGPPADPAEYAEFVGMVAARYAGKVSAYEVWNEPNYYRFWEPTPDPAAYTALLKVGYAAIKAADPNAVVVGGVIAAAPDAGTQAIDSVRFVTEMYEAGAAGYFDALSFHPYSMALFSEGGSVAGSPLLMANQIHDVMVAYGDGNKKIWATEYGMPSYLVTEAGQASYIDDFLTTWRDLDYAGPAYIHTLRDFATFDLAQGTMGVYKQDWTPKLAVTVIEAVIDENQAFLAGGGGIEL
ncbi:VCBS domain-containing protein [Mycobacterium sp. 3519A]|uniref:Ig-like domain-containing protein n=1 Tax=Mycobacterium sp. 3519A TaxID=2057184 RepID=UPI000C7C66CA|nr:VCBS domain-containing protein [Mycobacterium sp. 3519A]